MFYITYINLFALIMKQVYFIYILLFSLNGFSQPIYKGLLYGMTKSQAKKEFYSNKEDYTNIDLGNGFIWRMYHQNFIYDNGLAGILCTPKRGALGVSHENTMGYLEFTSAFFIKKGYKIFHEPQNWQYPELFRSKYGLLLENPDRTVMVMLYPFKQTSSNNIFYQPHLKVFNYDWFIDQYETGQKEVEEKQDKSGF